MNVEFKQSAWTSYILDASLGAFSRFKVCKENLNELRSFGNIGTASVCGLSFNTHHYGELKKMVAEKRHLTGVDLQAKG